LADDAEEVVLGDVGVWPVWLPDPQAVSASSNAASVAPGYHDCRGPFLKWWAVNSAHGVPIAPRVAVESTIRRREAQIIGRSA